MLRIKRITLDNFGPFKGVQTIDFPDTPGVVVVYGENMRGKTTLLNSIRYALYGYVTGRGSHKIDLSKIGNWEAAEEGQLGFKVILEFAHAEAHYELTRSCRPKEGVPSPKVSADFTQETLLRVNGSVLSQDLRDRALAQILPETVSRFFLFDGELLQEYEELLREESTMGGKIKDAIERILGLPVLTNGRSDLREITKAAESREAKALQKNQKTAELGAQQQNLIERRSFHEGEAARLRKERDQLTLRKGQVESEMKTREKLKTLLNERDTLHRQIKEIDQKVEEKRQRMREMMAEAWRWLLLPRIRSLTIDLDEKISAARASDTRQAIQRETVKLLQESLAAGTCGTCSRPLSSADVAFLTERLLSAQGGKPSPEVEAATTEMLQRRALLAGLPTSDRTEVLAALVGDVGDLRVEHKVKTDRIEEIQEQTKDVDESAIRKLASELEIAIKELAILEEGVRKEEEQVQAADDGIKRVKEQLNRMGDGSLSEDRQRTEICSNLHKLFDESVGVYRDHLRKTVEAEATRLFLRLTTETDYSQLRINENYGLTIIHKDGGAIPVRSAGAEHIVALSLMGALQRNAPLRGPIVMDSPFGRLDEGHTTRVVRTLPMMAEQVLLLVYEMEMEPALARAELGSKLLREYRIARRSARHSSLEIVTE